MRHFGGPSNINRKTFFGNSAKMDSSQTTEEVGDPALPHPEKTDTSLRQRRRCQALCSSKWGNTRYWRKWLCSFEENKMNCFWKKWSLNVCLNFLGKIKVDVKPISPFFELYSCTATFVHFPLFDSRPRPLVNPRERIIHNKIGRKWCQMMH